MTGVSLGLGLSVVELFVDILRSSFSVCVVCGNHRVHVTLLYCYLSHSDGSHESLINKPHSHEPTGVYAKRKAICAEFSADPVPGR